MDLDMALIRAFIVCAEELHFGRAAERLSMTQQALSKRIAKLESGLGTTMFDRSTRSVALTDAGQRFLLPAREALAAADAAVAAMQGSPRSLRVDVLHERLAPAVLTRRLIEEAPAIPVELSSRRTLTLTVPALLRGEIDLTFGRIVGRQSRTLSHRLIRLEPLMVVVDTEHPLAALDAVRPADLAEFGLWTSTPDSASEWSGLVSHLAQSFGCALRFPNVDNVTAEEILRWSRDRGPAFLTGTDVRNPEDPRLRVVDLVDPMPVYPWSLVWRTAERHPLVRHAVSVLTELSAKDGWCAALRLPHWPEGLAT
ncbi:LysR family transcriptional regulator [Planotetraspora sp. A-T 1434]|uniref:LysR family transcriptional regulator n=1 Tax=Planotetraspora sp. A-T 1434 TaxID=2979219 RepID=UPI0021C2515B|nr:LysR family transcriptional regulator [Planotetraspora sp. A-T 1434]MCT9933518.1 LysR family transcriptional regulator [Planotetraspora sp. A-T 1434]